jgi:hypothetical protein
VNAGHQIALSIKNLIKNCNNTLKTILSILHFPRYYVRIITHSWRIMTLARTGTSELTEEEWMELVALKEAINYSPPTVSASKMEKFSELMVRCLDGKGDEPIRKVS